MVNRQLLISLLNTTTYYLLLTSYITHPTSNGAVAVPFPSQLRFRLLRSTAAQGSRPNLHRGTHAHPAAHRQENIHRAFQGTSLLKSRNQPLKTRCNPLFTRSQPQKTCLERL